MASPTHIDRAAYLEWKVKAHAEGRPTSPDAYLAHLREVEEKERHGRGKVRR